MLYLNREHRLTQVLEAQLMGFPKAKRKDLIDALAYAPGLLAESERYFAGMVALGREVDAFLDRSAEDKALESLGLGSNFTRDWRV
jgi:hypothetical protein